MQLGNNLNWTANALNKKTIKIKKHSQISDKGQTTKQTQNFKDHQTPQKASYQLIQMVWDGLLPFFFPLAHCG